MTADAETDEPIPSWATVAQRALDVIRDDAGSFDPARAGSYAGADVERVRRAIDRGDGILAAHRCFGDDEVIDVELARTALFIARAMLRPLAGNAHG